MSTGKDKVCEYHKKQGCDTCYPDDIETRLALAIFRATRYRPHPAGGGAHYDTAKRILEDLPELRSVDGSGGR